MPKKSLNIFLKYQNTSLLQNVNKIRSNDEKVAKFVDKIPKLATLFPSPLV